MYVCLVVFMYICMYVHLYCALTNPPIRHVITWQKIDFCFLHRERGYPSVPPCNDLLKKKLIFPSLYMGIFYKIFFHFFPVITSLKKKYILRPPSKMD